MAPEIIINIRPYDFDAMKVTPQQLTIENLVNSNDVVLNRSQVLRCCILADMVMKKGGDVPTNQPMPLSYEYLVEATRREPYFTIQEKKAFPYVDETTGHWKVPNKTIKINDLLPVAPTQKVEPLSAIERAELEELREWELMENRRRRERETKFQKRKTNLILTKKLDKQRAKDIRAINHPFRSVQALKTGSHSHPGPSHQSTIPTQPLSIPAPMSNAASTSTASSMSTTDKPTLSAAAKPFVPQSVAPTTGTLSASSPSGGLAGLKFQKKTGSQGKDQKEVGQDTDVDNPEDDSLLNYRDVA